ncbi:ImmA/IrrE family metallo-endopeptidase [Agrobacterium larrymoorei]|uniref:Zn-dependent peptidase ImmA (M78 family) n=1 Tax=Agrobacterium larrymoorei TaxID=160699 RepID=A0ABU0UN44_9HYPH|nr:ImmA/IrrE family metallo-endopeptidase [Agrobacterium larrymoorei]MDQ1186377.1 Zn-dependent peptidase ImmA (M78 family) [Agrobacterium larrymoorei]
MKRFRERLTNQQIDAIVKHQKNIPVKLGELARDLGIEVKVATLNPGISGEIRKDSENNISKYKIRINRHEKKERQRFTLAHEIAHFLLHKDKIGDGLTEDILYRSTLSNALEYEANRFAAELIMPDAVLEEMQIDFESVDEDAIVDLAERFGVSKDAMRIKLGIA